MTSPPPSPTPHPRPSTSKFRFKQPPPHSSRSRSRSPTSETHRPHRHHQRHHHHHRSKRRKLSPPPAATSTLNTETAFRESLFDALADDEGAAFWEGVYGQPIHSYPRPSTAGGTAMGELEGMTDEEYVAYVRAKMWEKSHQHVVEERARREAERAGRKKREEGVEEALRRGEERRRGKRWRGAWEGYVRGWEGMVQAGGQGRAMRGRIPWPVLSGRREDVGKDEVERFFGHAEQYAGVGEGGLGGLLKVERVRWHPDKMQQRAGKEGVDGETMKMITAVFQVVDQMWSETKNA